MTFETNHEILNFEKIWIYSLLTWGHCFPWLYVGWPQLSNNLRPLDHKPISIQNLSSFSLSAHFQGEPETPGSYPETPDYPEYPGCAPETPDGNFPEYIYCGLGFLTITWVLFHPHAATLSSFTLKLALGAISTFPPFFSRKILREGSPPLRKLRRIVGFEVPARSWRFQGTLNFLPPDLKI